MEMLKNNKGVISYLSFDNEPRWLTIFIHVGFATAIVLSLGALVMTYLAS